MAEQVARNYPLDLCGENFEQMAQALSLVMPVDAWPDGAASTRSWRLRSSSDGTLTLVTGHYGAEWQLRASSETRECLSILKPKAGVCSVLRGGHLVEAGPGTILLVNSHEGERFFVRGVPHVADMLHMEWSVIARMVADIMDLPLVGSLDLSPLADGSCPSARLVVSLIETMIVGMTENGPLLRSPTAMSDLTQTLARLVIETIPHRLTPFLNGKPYTVAPWHVRKAIDFIHANIAKPITMQMVAKETGVSIRALENGFRSFKETTPSAYLRTLRLQAARQDLMDFSNQACVKDICLKWGFFHFGRFSATYKAFYGETPSETRQRYGLKEIL